LSNWTLWSLSLTAVFVSWITASALSLRIAGQFPLLHRALGEPSWRDWYPFWTFRLVVRGSLPPLPNLLRLLALSSMSCLLAGLGIIAFLAVRFLSNGANL
jgi:hypothetical protein